MRYPIISLCCSLLLTLVAHADIVHLTNGQQFEGIITKESASQITIKEDQLVLTFNRSKIERIEKKELPPQTEAPSGAPRESRDPPPEFVGFFDEIRKLDASLLVNQRAKIEVVKAQRHIAALEAKTKALKEQQIEERKLATKATSTRKYNAHIRTANECSTQHNALLKEVATAKKQLSHTQSSLNGYATQALHLRNDYQERYNTFMENGRRPEFQGYFDYIHQKLAKHQDALETGFQAFRGNAMVVRAHLNNKVSGNFIVDTGATMVLLHRGLAEKLGLDLTGEEIKATLADGTTQRMPSVNLQSVSVNGMTAFNVFGAVSDVPPGKGVDGLLGMSFLSQFEFRLDTQNGRLVLHPRR